jgi:diguanylate cyclase (GGDEF)-like protein/PAS domain S-box-containing protein
VTSKAIRSVLLIEDNAGDARLLTEMLKEQGGYKTALTWVTFMREAETYLASNDIDVILLDLGLADAQGLAALRRAHAAAPHVALVVLTGLDDELLALQALKEGAGDYLIKGEIEGRWLMRSMRYAIERKVMEEALFAEKELAQVTLASIGDAVISTDINGVITFLNAVAEDMTGWPLREATGRAAAEILGIQDADTGEAIDLVGTVIRENRTVRPESNLVLTRRDGGKIPVENCISPIRNREGANAGTVITLRDVSEVQAMSQQMIHSAQHDALTGLPNRILLNDRITQAIAYAARHNEQIAVLFLDLDHFKHINDSLGHAVGDKLLQSIAGRLAQCIRGSDTVSRQGGDEFIVLVTEMKEPQAALISANRLLAAVAAPHAIQGHDLHITASIGVSIYPGDGLDAESLIKNADTAMYQAKKNGPQSYQFFKQSMSVRAVERQSIEESLRRALERDEFALHYQPKINLLTGAITGVEALIRWMHPERGMIPPGQFIPVAEDTGLILPIGGWVLREACMQARAWRDAGLPDVTMAVNVSAMEFQDPNFIENLFAVLKETGTDPAVLKIELTESVLMKNAEGAITVLRKMRESGIKVAIDDFGTGYSSLSYLQRFPIDELKIDQSFVRQIGSGDGDTAIVTAVISMARSLRLRVVAEGVETPEELAFLREQKCDEVQGYYFSKPVPPQLLAGLLVNGVAAALAAPPDAAHGRPRKSKES